MSKLPFMPVSEREKNNQMLANNFFHFSQYPYPEWITTGYVGTSRAKVFRPEHFALSGAVVVGGNSYNEITYGLLLQAELLRLQFPNIKKMYIESSMLLRRPGRLIVEQDHRKYLPLLESIQPICSMLSDDSPCHSVFHSLIDMKKMDNKALYPMMMDLRGSIRFSAFFEDNEKTLTISDTSSLASLQDNGEQKSLPRTLLSKGDWKPETTRENIKVQRLRDVEGYIPGDGLFELIAAWGEKYNIKMVFFQPPVRSDLYSFQLEYGLGKHVADLERISKKYELPFINLNKKNLGYMDDWSIFSDEDHMETCVGSGLLTLALEEGGEKSRGTDELFPVIYRSDVQKKYSSNFNVCN
ncbi:hypothetical protein [Marinomonas primoryensis]|uniref:Uncharacterized protein n=1 Tax=Marinomonas primoryensis TaxID=178399 RepID=A0ABV0KYZ8_9GAMM